jgi:hypothetical protein
MTHRIHRPRLLVLVLLGSCLLGPTRSAAAQEPAVHGGKASRRRPPAVASDARLQAYLKAASARLEPEQRDALERIDDVGRRLLALRSYLRTGHRAKTRWAWSQARIESYERSGDYQAVLAELEKVRKSFAELNPGYTLRVNSKVRSLDQQLDKWNRYGSVGKAAAGLLGRARRELARPAYGAAADEADLQRFERFLRDHAPWPRPTVAAPGLSPHGQARAFDFQVLHGARLIAGMSTATAAQAWDEAGWTARLQEAVRRSTTKLQGPLSAPYEPWHYEYRP